MTCSVSLRSSSQTSCVSSPSPSVLHGLGDRVDRLAVDDIPFTPTARSLTATFNNNPSRPHTAADWLHAAEIRELLEYFGFNTAETVTVERSGGRIEFRQKLIRELCANNSTRSEKLWNKKRNPWPLFAGRYFSRLSPEAPHTLWGFFT